MNKPKRHWGAALLLWLASMTSAMATTVGFTATNLTGNTWEVAYTITNDTLAQDIDEFTIFFDANLFQNLTVGNTPADWDPLVIQPDPGLPDDGFYDALALVAGIAPGATLSGFSVVFDFLGSGTPGAQPFDIVDPVTFDALDSGTTQRAVVPVPAALWLFGSGLLGLAGANGRSRCAL